MRKGPIRFQNPIDTILIDCGSYLSPLFRHLHFTPNTLTSISAIFGFMSVYKMYNKDYKQAGMLYFISYMFDCFDGFYARKYNMVTKYGDFYDHIKDSTVALPILFMLFREYWKKDKPVKYLPFLLLFTFICSIIQLGCIEIHWENQNKTPDQNASMSLVKQLCSSNVTEAEKILQKIRYLGCGTSVLSLSLAIMYLDYLH